MFAYQLQLLVMLASSCARCRVAAAYHRSGQLGLRQHGGAVRTSHGWGLCVGCLCERGLVC